MLYKRKLLLGSQQGFVDMTMEAVMSGNGTKGAPCTKYKDCGTYKEVPKDKCKKKECCNVL